MNDLSVTQSTHRQKEKVLDDEIKTPLAKIGFEL